MEDSPCVAWPIRLGKGNALSHGGFAVAFLIGVTYIPIGIDDFSHPTVLLMILRGVGDLHRDNVHDLKIAHGKANSRATPECSFRGDSPMTR